MKHCIWLLVGLLVGCGQKGDLYLPDSPAPTIYTPAPITPVTTDNTQDF